MKRISSKKWVFMVLAVMWIVFIGCAVLVILIDPYLHYRIPDNGLNYALRIPKQRYHNDGLIRHFDYDAVITGTSMTENFKSSEFDKLFEVNSIKIPFSGGSYKDVNGACKRVFDTHPDTKLVLRGLDLSRLVNDKDLSQYSDNPEYLYNDTLIDDVNYWLNKMTILEGCMVDVILYSAGIHSSYSPESNGAFLDSFSFDDYSSWHEYYNFGREYVLSDYFRPEKSEDIVTMKDDVREMIRGNVSQNVTKLAEAHHDTRFLLFFTPYSICYWDSLVREGKLEWEIEAQKIAIEEILKYDNIELYSFCNNFDIVTDLNNYRDVGHYSGDVNSRILAWMKKGDYRLTWDNYVDYLQEISEFYSMYDYEEIFK